MKLYNHLIWCLCMPILIIYMVGCENIKVESKGPLSNILTSSSEENSKKVYDNTKEDMKCILPKITYLEYSTVDMKVPSEFYSEGGEQWVQQTIEETTKKVLNAKFDASGSQVRSGEYLLKIFFEINHANFQHGYLSSKTKRGVQIDQYEVDIGTKVTYEFTTRQNQNIVLSGTAEGYAKNAEKQTVWEQFAVLGGKEVFRRCFEATMRGSIRNSVNNVVSILNSNGKCQ